MVTRVRIEGMGESAGEVERHINAVASAISELIGDGGQVDLGQMVIQREDGEPAGHTAFSGRGLLYLNVAPDAPQVAWLTEQTGSCATLGPNPFYGELEADGPPGRRLQVQGEPLSPGQHMAATLGFEEPQDRSRTS